MIVLLSHAMCFSIVLSVFLPIGVFPAAAGTPPEIDGCTIFPCNSIWNTPVDDLPIHPHSSLFIESIGAADNVHADFGAGLWNGGPIGIPYVSVPGAQPLVPILFDYSGESDPGPYPIPPDAPIEGGSESSGDRHVIVLDRDNCVLYEVFSAYKQSDNSWAAGSGAVFDLQSHDLRPDGWTSADAAGLPILPGLVRYDEVASGEIRHAIRFTVNHTRRAYVWPARHYASSLAEIEYPPMGVRFRLKAEYDISGFSAANQTILRAMKKYGIILADNGGDWYLSGVPDDRWDNDDLHELHQVTGAGFEAVDVSSLVHHSDSAMIEVELADVIEILKMLTDQETISCIYDYTGDGIIGLEDAVYSLVRLSGD